MYLCLILGCKTNKKFFMKFCFVCIYYILTERFAKTSTKPNKSAIVSYQCIARSVEV